MINVDAVEPVEELKKPSCADGLRGLLADCPEMSVDRFLERMRIDAELDI